MRTHLLRVATYKPGKPIEELQRELGLKTISKLASNENPFPPSPKVVRAICRAATRVNRYPESIPFYLRERLCKSLHLDPSQLIFGNGSDELIVFAVRSLVGPGDEIMTSTPTFLIYKIAGMVEGIRVREIPMKNFKYDLKEMKSSITDRTKLIFIANPDNPTGSYLTREEISMFMTDLPEHVVVFFDEAYYEFAKGLSDYPNTLEFVHAGSPVVVSRTFSKYYGLAGLRIGYAFGRKDLIDLMSRVREPFNVNLLAQEAGVAALDSEGYYRKILKMVIKERSWLEKNLSRLGIKFVPSVTNFILIQIGPKANELVDWLLHRGVIVRYMKAWGLPEYIRVTVGKPEENRRFLRLLKEWYKANGR